jgi:phage anti-repressor protein
MTELINISTNAQGASVISARELYAFLEVKSRFNDWIKNRIDQYGFVVDQDYTSLTKNLVSGGWVHDYALSLDMAKELSMVERNAKGKQARQYFIDCEKKLHGYDLRTLHTIDRYLTPLLADQQRQINTLQDEVGRLVGLVEQVVQKQPVGGSIPHQANADRQHREIVPPVSQNRAIIGIPRTALLTRVLALTCAPLATWLSSTNTFSGYVGRATKGLSWPAR